MIATLIQDAPACDRLAIARAELTTAQQRQATMLRAHGESSAAYQGAVSEVRVCSALVRLLEERAALEEDQADAIAREAQALGAHAHERPGVLTVEAPAGRVAMVRAVLVALGCVVR